MIYDKIFESMYKGKIIYCETLNHEMLVDIIFGGFVNITRFNWEILLKESGWGVNICFHSVTTNFDEIY